LILLTNKIASLVWVLVSKVGEVTLVYFHISQRLPSVHSDNPFITAPAAREIDDELGSLSAEGVNDSLEALHGEFCVREKVGR